MFANPISIYDIPRISIAWDATRIIPIPYQGIKEILQKN